MNVYCDPYGDPVKYLLLLFLDRWENMQMSTLIYLVNDEDRIQTQISINTHIPNSTIPRHTNLTPQTHTHET